MNEITIRLNDPVKTGKYLTVCGTFRGYVDLISDKATIDGKSLMALFSLDLSKPVRTRIITADPEEEQRFIEAMEEFK